ncbi:BQ2448_2415 [Microbotryum intermedium]|uniref:BQ2448_2415 protein n=1 Tax=Microbotryum intermedium TaxID=269621 RepID=A0A238F868_9BASI|nr:BQ2448_2415 [Microbotryum intermedium]
MSLARSCGHLARFAGVRMGVKPIATTATTSFTRPTASRRSIHAFAPTAPLLKKKPGKKNASSATPDAFDAEEFEEDQIDDIDNEPTHGTTSSSSLNDDTAAPRSASDYTTLHAYLSKRLELPHFAFKSNIPSTSAVRGLLQRTVRDDRSRTLQLLKLWRQRNLPCPDASTSTEFVRAWTRMNEIEEMVEVLARRDLYGLGLVVPGEFTKALQTLTTIEGEVADAKTLMPKFESAKTIQELLRLEGVKDLASIVSTLAMALRLNEPKVVRRLPALLDDLLEEARAINPEDAAKSLQSVPGKELQAWIVEQVKECKNRVEDPKDRAALGRILDRVQ